MTMRRYRLRDIEAEHWHYKKEVEGVKPLTGMPEGWTCPRCGRGEDRHGDLNGWPVCVGDYIVKNGFGELMFYEREDFEAEYEEVADWHIEDLSPDSVLIVS